MNEKTNGRLAPPDDSWLTAEFFQNRRTFPQKELARYAGRHVAWSWDGTLIVADADSDGDLVEKVKSLGLNPSRVVYSYVELPDAVYI